MKKVFLLATTAVFMTTANAWADPVTVSVPQLAVQAELTPLAAFTKVKDLNFGGMVFDKTDLGDGDYVSFGDIVIDSDTPYYDASPAVKAHYGTTSRGKYTYTGSLNFNGGTFTIGGQACTLNVNGSCSTVANIAVGDNAKFGHVQVTCTASPNECYFGGPLFVKKSYLEGLNSTATLSENLTITYNY